MWLCANFFEEDIYVVDRRELLDLAEGHVKHSLAKQNAFFQKFPGDGGDVRTVSLHELVQTLEKNKLNIVEHNGKLGLAGHFAAYKRTHAPPEKMKQLLLKQELEKKPKKSAKVQTLATTKGKRMGVKGSEKK